MRWAVDLPAAAPWSVAARGSRDHDAMNTDRSPPAFSTRAAGARCGGLGEMGSADRCCCGCSYVVGKPIESIFGAIGLVQANVFGGQSKHALQQIDYSHLVRSSVHRWQRGVKDLRQRHRKRDSVRRGAVVRMGQGDPDRGHDRRDVWTLGNCAGQMSSLLGFA